MRALVALVWMSAVATAQPAAPACIACARGDELIERFGLLPLRDLRGELAQLTLSDPLTPDQYAGVVDLRRRDPALTRLGALDDIDLRAIASALCNAPSDSSCGQATHHALRCLADRCAVDLPPAAMRADVVELPPTCTKYTSRKRTSALGLGVEWGTGWQRSGYPTDGGAWSVGIETRLRLGRRLGAVARVDRIAGRDEAVDADGNGTDDHSTGSITRIAALAGPSFVLDHTRFENTRRFVRVDLLAGYLGTQSQPDESGLAVGVDLNFQLSVVQLGARVVQGFAGADNATVVLAHLGITAGSPPPDPRGADCDSDSKRSSRLALAFEYPLGGYGISSLGYLATGIAFEAIWHLSPSFDAVTRADLMLFPGDERDRVIHQALLGGVRWDHGKRRGRRSATGLFSTLLAGYSHEAGLTPSSTDSGPIVDASLGWGVQSREGAAYFRLHGRMGLTPENVDYLAIFVTGGFELRFDPKRWKDRT